MNAIKQLLQSYKTIHTVTKRLLGFSAVYILSITLASGLLYLLAGRSVDYYTAMLWAGDLFGSVRPCVGVAALGGLLLEGTLHGAE